MADITQVIDDNVLEKYNEYYFSLHPRAKKNPISQPYHESMNVWMIMKRVAMNGLKQRWKDFIIWFVTDMEYNGMQIDKCEIQFSVYYPTKRRRDPDNSTPKFIIDGFVESGMLIDDDCTHIEKLTLKCENNSDYPRTEIKIKIMD